MFFFCGSCGAACSGVGRLHRTELSSRVCIAFRDCQPISIMVYEDVGVAIGSGVININTTVEE